MVRVQVILRAMVGWTFVRVAMNDSSLNAQRLTNELAEAGDQLKFEGHFKGEER